MHPPKLTARWTHRRRWARRLARDAQGNVAVETALVSIPLLLFVFGIMAVGRAVWLQNALDVSVAEAARCASVNPTLCGTTAEVQTYAANQAGAGLDAAIFSVASASCGNRVSASYPLGLTIPFMTVSVNLKAQACYPV